MAILKGLTWGDLATHLAVRTDCFSEMPRWQIQMADKTVERIRKDFSPGMARRPA